MKKTQNKVRSNSGRIPPIAFSGQTAGVQAIDFFRCGGFIFLICHFLSKILFFAKKSAKIMQNGLDKQKLCVICY